MSKLVLFRKTSDPAPKLSKTKIMEALETINGKARVNRDPLVTFMLNGGYAKLPIVKQSIIDSDAARKEILDCGFEIPSDCLGRVGEATASSRESLRLWIKQNLAPFGIDVDGVSVILVD